MATSDIMKAYIDTTKTFIQLSSAGLVLPLTIHAKVLGLFGTSHSYSWPAFILIAASWACFLVAIAAAALYQYAAVKFTEYEEDPRRTYMPRWLDSLVRKQGPGVVYAVMVGGFGLGALLTVTYSSIALWPARTVAL